MRGTAVAIGVIGLVLIALGVVIALTSDRGVSTPSSGILIRSGAVLGALALALRSIRKPSVSSLLVAGGGLALVLVRPGLVWAALAGWVLWIVLGRQRSTDSNDS